MTDQVALVTGASSGFGQLTASLLARRGYRVFGTSRHEQAERLPGVEMLQMEVQSDASVQACLERLTALTGRIDVLVSNAGQAHASLIEETPLGQAKEVFETNFWGAVRVTRAVLPMMRQQRSGRIVVIGSLAGLIGMAGQGFYSASKFALEGYCESLSLEVEPFNIQVSILEPGFFQTHLHHAMLRGGGVALPDYQAMHAAVATAFDRGVARGGEPGRVAELVAKVVEAGSPRLRYRIGSDAVWVPRLKAWLPERLFRLGMRRRFQAS